MGWAARNKHKGPGKGKTTSNAARVYNVKHSADHYKYGEGFTDGRGVNYMVRPDGSLERGGKSVQSDPAKPKEILK